MDQPLRGYAKTEMEVQTYPVGLLNYAYAGGPAVEVVPYDVTSWTMPMAMGVPSYNVTDPSIFNVPVSRVPVIIIAGGIIGDPVATYGYAISHKYNDAFTAMNRLFKAGFGPLYLAQNAFTYGAVSFDIGTVIVPKTSPAQAAALDAAIADLATKLAVPFYRLSTNPAPGLPVYQITKPKIGVLYTYSTSENEGWTRWLLDHGVTGVGGNPLENEIDFVRLNPISIDTGFVNGTGDPLSSFNVIVVPPGVSISATGSSTSRAPGFQGSAYCGPYVCPVYDPHGPSIPPYVGEQLGINAAGVTNLKNFMTNGGTIILETPSSTTAITNLGLTGLTVNRPTSAEIPSYGGDGVMLKLGSFANNPVTYGLPSNVAGFWENDQYYTVTTATPLAYFNATNPLMSGYLVDNTHLLNGKVAAALVPVGTGRAILFAFRLENRDKNDATFPFLFNSIYYGTAIPAILPP
jgi:hypothetical protein